MPAQRISREAVIARAREVFAHEREPTMEQIAAAAAVSQATLYKWFGTRRGLMDELGVEPAPSLADRMVTAAGEIVAESGLAGLSVDSAASRAGISRAAAYQRFPGKASLFEEVVRFHSPFEDLEAVLTSMWGRPPAEVLPAYGAMMARLSPVQVAVLRTLHLDRSEAVSQAYGSVIALCQLLAADLGDQMAAGRIRQMDPFVAMMNLSSPIFLHVLDRDVIDKWGLIAQPLDEVLDEFIDDWIRSMKPRRSLSQGRQGRPAHD